LGPHFQTGVLKHSRAAADNALNSQRFWKKWERVGEADLEAIAKALSRRLPELDPPQSDCLMFDTTNYFT